MTNTLLTREALIFSRYLSGAPPNGYVLARYIHFHQLEASRRFELAGYDRFLVSFARRGVLFTRIADVYASRFRKTAALRKKLVLMLALLECTPAAEFSIDRSSTAPVAFFLFVYKSAMYTLLLLVSVVLLAPAHVLFSKGERA